MDHTGPRELSDGSESEAAAVEKNHTSPRPRSKDRREEPGRKAAGGVGKLSGEDRGLLKGLFG